MLAAATIDVKSLKVDAKHSLVRLVYGMCDSLAKSIILATANSLAPLAKTGRPRVSHELLLDQFIRVLPRVDDAGAGEAQVDVTGA